MIPVPQELIAALRRRILSKCANAEAGWKYANQDEDSITGDFLDCTIGQEGLFYNGITNKIIRPDYLPLMARSRTNC
jgi:hypothetical protein